MRRETANPPDGGDALPTSEVLMPRKRKRLNRKIIAWNLAEAIEQLKALHESASNGGLDEIELTIGLCHAYHHLNFAWNIRYVPTAQYAKLTDRQFDRWGKYPLGIEKLLEP
jgi:hypothetical protein